MQVSDTEVFSAKRLNQFRFQYLHDDTTDVPRTIAPTITVLDAFTGGGNAMGKSTDIQNHYEVQNLTSFFLGKHTLVVGGRLRDIARFQHIQPEFQRDVHFPEFVRLRQCRGLCGRWWNQLQRGEPIPSCCRKPSRCR